MRKQHILILQIHEIALQVLYWNHMYVMAKISLCCSAYNNVFQSTCSFYDPILNQLHPTQSSMHCILVYVLTSNAIGSTETVAVKYVLTTVFHCISKIVAVYPPHNNFSTNKRLDISLKA